MSRHLSKDLGDAYHRVLALSGQVEEMVHKAIRALIGRQSDLASEVIGLDEEIDRVEVQIEEECLKMLALHQPVAADLRRLTTMMKINNDLERIADLACNIAERANDLVEFETYPIPEQLSDMAGAATRMVRDSIDAFVNLDIESAYQVIARDDTIDEMNVEIIDQVTSLMQQNPAWIEPALLSFSASRSIEQIGDHAVNVAEDVIYMVNGVIVRHRHNDPRLRPHLQ
ncbi:MAG: phosphate signaling complex protein PhoU [bacterium]|nr:phosphate signaling complex protein PhoU [bacterium]